MNILSWLLRLAVAVILVQTLFFKFTGAEESVYIFTTLGAEPWGRYASGVMELIAAGLLLVPATVAYGATLSVGIAAGAVMSHLTLLGLEVKGDGGLLFGLALMILVCSLALVAIHRRKLPLIGHVLAA